MKRKKSHRPDRSTYCKFRLSEDLDDPARHCDVIVRDFTASSLFKCSQACSNMAACILLASPLTLTPLSIIFISDHTYGTAHPTNLTPQLGVLFPLQTLKQPQEHEHVSRPPPQHNRHTYIPLLHPFPQRSHHNPLTTDPHNCIL